MFTLSVTSPVYESPFSKFIVENPTSFPSFISPLNSTLQFMGKFTSCNVSLPVVDYLSESLFESGLDQISEFLDTSSGANTLFKNDMSILSSSF